MPTTFTDQFFNLDPANPPLEGTAVAFQVTDAIDQDDDGNIDLAGGDTVNGLTVTESFSGDSVTLSIAGVGDVTYLGSTFYLSDGSAVFTPLDGQILQDGIFVTSSFVPDPSSISTDSFGPPCFLSGMRISTPQGERPVENLEVGDTVSTVDGGAAPIAFIQTKDISGRHLEDNPRHAPIRIPSKTFSARKGCADLLVSPQHRILIKSDVAHRMYGASEILAPAAQLLGFGGIRRERPNGPVRNRLQPSEIYGMVPARTFAHGKKLKRLLQQHERRGILLIQPPVERPVQLLPHE